jgi:hypothetical protein
MPNICLTRMMLKVCIYGKRTNLDKVFYYSEFDNAIDDEGHTPFILGIQQPLQLEWMRKYGHNSILDNGLYIWNKSL